MEWRPATNGFRALAACMLCTLAFGAASVRSAGADMPRYDTRIAEIVTPERFAGEGAAVLIDRRIHTWSFDKTVIEHAYAVKILTREGIERYGNFISDRYHTGYYTYGIEAAVVSPRGERAGIERDDIRTVEFGNDMHRCRLALPGLEIGSIIEISERIESEYPITSGLWSFCHCIPTLRSELVFRVPAGARVHFNFTPKTGALVPSPHVDGVFENYTITVEAMPPYTDEPYMPRRFAGNPTVFYYIWQVTMEDYLRFRKIEYDDRLLAMLEEQGIPWELPLGTRSWREIAGSFTEYFDPKTWRDEDRADEYRAMARSMVDTMPVAYKQDPIRTLDAILAYFHQQFESIELPFFYRNPERCADRREGDPFQLAYMLKWMLDELNIQPSLVIASDAAIGLLDQRNPDPFILRRPLLLIDGTEADYWIDPFAVECGVNQIPWEYQGVRALRLLPDKEFEFMTTPLDAATVNCIVHEETIEIDPEGGLFAHAQISITGQYLLLVRRTRAAETAGESTEEFAILGRLLPESITMDDVTVETDTRDTMIISYAHSVERFGETAGGLMNLDLSGWCDIPILDAFESESRKYEIMVPFPATRHTTLRIDIPSGYAVHQLPGNEEHRDTWFSYFRTCQRNGNAIEFRRRFAIRAPVVGALHYGTAKRAIGTIQKLDRETIVLERRS